MKPLGGTVTLQDRIRVLADRLPRWPILLLGLAVAVLVAVGAAEGCHRHREGRKWALVMDPRGMKYAYAATPAPTRGWQEGRRVPPRRAGTRRVICIGDEVTFGTGVPVQAAWPARLEAALGPDRVEVHNAAVSGWDAEQVASLVQSRLAAWTPDLVVWGAYPDDRIPTWTLRDEHGRHPVFVGSSVPFEVRLVPWEPVWLLTHSALFRRLQGGAVARGERRGRLPDPPQSWFTTQVSLMYAWSRHTRVPVLVLTIPPHVVRADGSCGSGRVDSQRCASEMRSYAKNAQEIEAVGLPRVDGVAAYAAGKGPYGLEGAQDPRHPNPAGHEALALAVAVRAADLLGIAWPLVDPDEAKKTRSTRRRTQLPGTSVRLPARQTERPAEAVTLPGRQRRGEGAARLPSGPGPQKEAP